MRITYLHQYFTTPTMHGGTRSFELARRLVAMGHEVRMVTSDTEPGPGVRGWRETEEAGIQVHWLALPYAGTMGYAERVRAFARFALRAAQRAMQLPGDVVFATSTPLTIAVPGLLASLRRRVPFVFEVRDLWPAVPIALGVLHSAASIAAARALERAAYRGAAHIVALSPGMKAGVEAAGVEPEKVTVIPNLCEAERFRVPASEGEAFRRAHPWLGERPLLLYAGSLGLVNGLGYLVRTAVHLRALDPEARVLILGNGREQQALHALAGELGVLNQNLFFLPSVPKAQMPAVLSAASIATSTCLAVPALEDNSANKFFDAMAAGRPLAVNYGGWQARLIEQEGLGLCLPPQDPAAAAALLAPRLRDRRWLAEAGARAQRVGVERFSADLAAQRLAEVLTRAAGSRC